MAVYYDAFVDNNYCDAKQGVLFVASVEGAITVSKKLMNNIFVDIDRLKSGAELGVRGMVIPTHLSILRPSSTVCDAMGKLLCRLEHSEVLQMHSTFPRSSPRLLAVTK